MNIEKIKNQKTFLKAKFENPSTISQIWKDIFFNINSDNMK